MVKSAEAGEVVYAGDLPGYGKVVVIKHDNDWATVYARTVNPRVTQGQRVAKGQDLADIDPAANRLHFEVCSKGRPMDPRSLLTGPERPHRHPCPSFSSSSHDFEQAPQPRVR